MNAGANTLLPRAERFPLLAVSAIRAAAARAPDRVALRTLSRQGDDLQSMSYRQFAERMNRISQATALLGLGAGDRVAVLGPNCAAFLEISCGLSAAGIPVATLSNRLQPDEVGNILADCGARVLFVHPSCDALVRASDRERIRVVRLDEEYERLLGDSSPEPLSNPALADEIDPFVIPYTSGTTGKPKGVVVSHRSRSLCCAAMGVEYGCFGPDDRFLALAPLSHGAGFVMALACLYHGATCDLLQGFDAETTLKILHRSEHSGVFFVPTHFHAIFALSQDVLDRYAGHRLKTIISNAAPLPQETKVRIVEYFGEGLLHECYGSTEGGIVTNLRPADQLRKERCVGLPFPGTLVKLVDDAGGPVARGEVGELLSRSPCNFSGYWNAPGETDCALRDGWVSAGDLARQDEEGHYYIVDRKKDMIISGGLNVYPREVEDVLAGHAQVEDVAVVGVADDFWGERVTAFVVAPAIGDLAAELAPFCAAQLADYKRPRSYYPVSELPRNSNGKVLKRELRERALVL